MQLFCLAYSSVPMFPKREAANPLNLAAALLSRGEYGKFCNYSFAIAMKHPAGRHFQALQIGQRFRVEAAEPDQENSDLATVGWKLVLATRHSGSTLGLPDLRKLTARKYNGAEWNTTSKIGVFLFMEIRVWCNEDWKFAIFAGKYVTNTSIWDGLQRLRSQGSFLVSRQRAEEWSPPRVSKDRCPKELSCVGYCRLSAGIRHPLIGIYFSTSKE